MQYYTYFNRQKHRIAFSAQVCDATTVKLKYNSPSHQTPALIEFPFINKKYISAVTLTNRLYGYLFHKYFIPIFASQIRKMIIFN